ncbi:hydrolase [Ethanoligenens harbinense]|uniref:Dihydrodipicolinate synthase/N-acetylneuraminate lyase n=1 Tax=Ethanoligenens harbinense (strain DSM 18485 / JCM 12961 / CGMCC 1.5033 / YUAN-3) TaxID=663278 RepID=E6U659_ETHHY|nr:hydrolase [Ethanoligenens harbinense]ADU25738.1 dihydrodipicolinate synthase/N-acetylneuraminate lyase [Ethanoligenens harbinense YUAN-3]AVQ94908.1 hydrolase [Ethanoligenens harbinense YUAN-3]AYF37600.1 hydrolase [Ethanoligenens harbinense]AYF40320.1 hydrolase [Ethanoligenens harbinense]QCN91156.1 hydrolase [Ethanoligenens harbinense]
MEPFIPEFEGNLRRHMLKVPESIRQASGIKIFGKLLKSFVFTTDVSVIRNVNADAVIAVYPFTPQPIITQAIMLSADIPVFCGIGGGITMGKRVINNALNAEFQGAMGVVVNAPTANDIIALLCETVDLPVVVTVVSDEDISSRVEAGASIINVSGGPHTADIVASIRSQYPKLPIIATGGPTDESISKTIRAGANAVTWTPPSSAEILAGIMRRYRTHPEDLQSRRLEN